MQSSHSGFQDFDRLLDALYDRALASNGDCFWCASLAKLCQAFGASVGIAGRDTDTDAIRILHRYQRKAAAGRCGYCLGETAGTAMRVGPEGATVAGRDGRRSALPDGLAAAEMLAGSRPSHTMKCTWPGRTEGPALIGLSRAPDTAEFASEDRTALASLTPHLQRMASMRRALVRERSWYAQLVEALDHLPIAMFIVSRSARVHYLNHPAKELLQQGDGLVMREGRTLAADSAPAAPTLRRALVEMASPDGTHAHEGTVRIVVPRRARELPLVCAVSRVSAAQVMAGGSSDPVLAVMVADPERGPGQHWSEFGALYRLTTAETRLVGMLARGLGLFQAAEQLSITRNTARTHMRSIHAKVGTSRHTDLIRILERFDPFDPADALPRMIAGSLTVGRLTPRGDEP